MSPGGLPLAGLRVVVTRARHQAGGLEAAIQALGGEAPLLPLLDVVPPDDLQHLRRALDRIGSFDALVFTSVNAVEAVEPSLAGRRSDTLVAAVGEATASALAAAGVEDVAHPDPARSRAEGLLALLRGRLSPAAHVLLPQAADARSVLAEGLARAGYEVVAVTAYDKRLPGVAASRYRELFADHPYGWVTFTSPRIVRHFRQLAGVEWAHRKGELRAASIGPVTSSALRAAGVEPAAEAVAPGEPELVEAIVEAVGGGA